MTYRYPGGLVRRTAANTSITGASGVWDLGSQAQAVKTNTWPISGLANPISGSLRFRSSASAYLNRTPGSAGNRQIFTWSGWVKKTVVGSSTNNVLFCSTDASTSTGWLHFNTGNYGSADTLTFEDQASSTALVTTQVFRDVSAWYHIVLAVDTTQATNTNRVKLYVNGSQVTAFSTSTYPSQNANTNFNRTSFVNSIGCYFTGTSSFFNGYLAEVNFIDGQALTPSSFGQTSPITGVWEPIKYTGTYGTNGFYLSLSDTSSIGKDFSGNGNNWTPNNISTTNDSTFDLMRDVPTQWAPQGVTDVGGVVRGNYATLNPLDAQGTATLSDANLTLASSSATHRNRKATFVVPSTGKWYWELTTSSTCSASVILGWGLQTTAAATDSQAGNADTFMAQNDANQDIWNQTTSVLSTGSAVAGGSIRQVAYDADTGKIWFGINNTWYSSTDLTSGNPSAGTNQCLTLSAGSYFPTITCYNLTANANFGQRPFTYTPPSGFKSLCTTNLPTPTIGATSANAANKYFDATLITGTAATQVITNAGGFQPDFVWLKSRTNANNPTIYDAIRGVNTVLYPALTNAEQVGTAQLTAFNSNGFTLGASENANDSNGEASVGWQWRGANGTVSNTAGTITSTVSANTSAGFSVVTYTGNGTSGATVGHGLGVTPSMVILKPRSTVTNWQVKHTSLNANQNLELNSTAAVDTAPGSGYISAISSTTLTLLNGGSAITNVNGSGTTYVAYCFAQIAGYSAFGSYTGNGSTDGPFVYTGFRPRYVMVKNTVDPNNWTIFDTARNTYNIIDLQIYPTTDAEVAGGSSNGIDFLSNGFKLRSSFNWGNRSGDAIIYMAFAEFPFKNSLAR